MKKALMIVAGIAVVLIGAVVTMALYLIGKQEKDFNTKRTEKARAARIANLQAQPEPQPEREDFTELEQIQNEKSN
jgi:hypothetical protein